MTMENVTYIKPKSSLDRAVDSLKRAWEENPVAVMSAAGILFAGAAKVLNGVNSFRNSRAWDQEVQRRREKDRSRRA
jgi:hypothetical protein